MMRQISVCLPLVLSVGLGSAILVGQQTQAASPIQAQTSNAKSAAAPTHKAAVHRSHRRHAKAAVRKGKKRPDYRPEYSENSVEVINGDATKKVVFHDDQGATTVGKRQPAGTKDVPAPMKVEVVNGASTDTQYFYDKGQQQPETARNQPVVIGIQSSDTRVAGGNKRPVVTAVTSSGVQDGKSVSTGGQPVTKQVSPRPKRPAYQPGPH